MGTITEIDREIIFFDGVCNLCNSSVNFVIDRDNKKRYSFASLQSGFAQEVLLPLGVDGTELESIVLVKGHKVYRKSSAALEIARHLSGPWPLLYSFKIIPPFFRDLVYDFIARNRYSWFGKQDSCRIPTPDIRERFLDSAYVS